MLAHSGYSRLDRWLHRLALGLPSLAELSFDLDQRACRAQDRAPAAAEGEHVFVTGLARAGTTVLMRQLHASGQFRSLTYRDMPFPLAPNLWRRAAARWKTDQGLHERAHGDGITVGVDSPEALEEVFWRIHCGEQYILPEGLLPHSPRPDVLRRFQGYVAAILASGEDADGVGPRRYLSKNNNNLLRLPAIGAALPSAWIVVPFRDPAAHALSLWRQHGRFCAMQAEDPFVLSYMNWLVHHEFGHGHRPFLTGAPLPPSLNPSQPDYWLEVWIRAHELLLKHQRERVLFVSHESLCDDPATWPRLARKLGLPSPGTPTFAPSAEPPSAPFRLPRMKRAGELYDALRAASRGW